MSNGDCVSTELTYLAWSAFLCIVLWLPYVLERAQSQGLGTVLTYPENPPAPAAWAQRAQRAHLNMVENLPAFAALVIIAHLTDANAAGEDAEAASGGADEFARQQRLVAMLVHRVAHQDTDALFKILGTARHAMECKEVTQ